MTTTPETLTPTSTTGENTDADTGVNSEANHQIIQFARRVYAERPDWVTFFRQILGLEGIARRLYPTDGQIALFDETPEFLAIQEMLAELRQNGPIPADQEEDTRVITVRLPSSMHELLKSQSHEKKTSSLNNLIPNPLWWRPRTACDNHGCENGDGWESNQPPPVQTTAPRL